MSNNSIRWVAVFGFLVIVAIAVQQYFWFSRAFDEKQRTFSYECTQALAEVSDELRSYNGSMAKGASVIEQINSNYFTVRIDDNIDSHLLESLLKRAFLKRGLQMDFEYGIYDCSDDKMVYGNYISYHDQSEVLTPTELKKWEKEDYYFGVFFPEIETSLVSEMPIWLWSTISLLAIVFFFVYAISIMLQQKRLSEIQRDFINNMTHEFKTPLSTIHVSSEVLQKEGIINDPVRLKRYAEVIQQETIRLRDQVERVLQIDEVDGKKKDFQWQRVDLAALIRQQAKAFAVLLEPKGGEIHLNLPQTLFIDKGDELHLSNVFFNLIDNAIKYCEKVPSIKISSDQSKEFFKISIADNGIGISTKNQKEVFSKFFRVSQNDRHDVKGFGLGLHYVKSIMTAHKGKIEVSSVPNKGSVFNLFFKK